MNEDVQNQKLPIPHRAHVNYETLNRCLVFVLALAAFPTVAQTPDEHSSHHPAGADPAPPSPDKVMPGMPTNSPSAPSPAPAMKGMAPGSPPMNMPAPAPNAPGGGGMMDMMSGMMKAKPCMGENCGAGAGGTPIYPSLMTLPALTREKRAEIDALATQQMKDGMERFKTGSAALEQALKTGDDAAMEQSVALIHQSLDELGAGIAARRVLVEGKAPRNLALDWFKREMNLASPIDRDKVAAPVGATVLHIFVMTLLITFALTMVAMYFYKMRRAMALFERVEPGSGPPPPGSAPPFPGPGKPSSPEKSPDVASSTRRGSPQTVDPPAKGSVTSTGEARDVLYKAPVTANWRGQLLVGSIITETLTVKTFRLSPIAKNSQLPFTFVPGQFLNVTFFIGGARMNRSYSISSSPIQKDYIELTVRREPRGAVSRHMLDLLKIGDRIEAGGPVGRFSFDGTAADSIVLIAGGVGITPMMSIARYLTDISWAGDIFLIYACGAPDDFIFRHQIEALQLVNPRFHVTVVMSRAEGADWKGLRGHISKEILAKAVPTIISRRVHLCGPPKMMEATRVLLQDLGVPPDSIKTELFGAVKPGPTAPGTALVSAAPATGPMVTFSKNNKSAKIRTNQTILELSEELAIGIENSCRIGTCGVCKVKITSGEVVMAVEDALDASDKVNGIILACQAVPTTEVKLEA